MSLCSVSVYLIDETIENKIISLKKEMVWTYITTFVVRNYSNEIEHFWSSNYLLKDVWPEMTS